jgi:hypothetical protein
MLSMAEQSKSAGCFMHGGNMKGCYKPAFQFHSGVGLSLFWSINKTCCKSPDFDIITTGDIYEKDSGLFGQLLLQSPV